MVEALRLEVRTQELIGDEGVPAALRRAAGDCFVGVRWNWDELMQPTAEDSRAAPAPAGQPYLRIRDLTKRFGSFTALRNISLDVQQGEFICFLGPSGCGKTTLLRAIAGLDVQTTGTVEQAGKDISNLPPAQRDFGIVFQSYATNLDGEEDDSGAAASLIWAPYLRVLPGGA